MTLPAQADIVERLREADANSQQRTLGSRIFGEAAATISRLTADNEALRKEVERVRDGNRYAILEQYATARAEAAESRADALAQEVERLRLPEGTPMLVAGTEIIISFASVDDAHRAFDALEYAMSREPAALGDRP